MYRFQRCPTTHNKAPGRKHWLAHTAAGSTSFWGTSCHRALLGLPCWLHAVTAYLGAVCCVQTAEQRPHLAGQIKTAWCHQVRVVLAETAASVQAAEVDNCSGCNPAASRRNTVSGVVEVCHTGYCVARMLLACRQAGRQDVASAAWRAKCTDNGGKRLLPLAELDGVGHVKDVCTRACDDGARSHQVLRNNVTNKSMH